MARMTNQGGSAIAGLMQGTWMRMANHWMTTTTAAMLVMAVAGSAFALDAASVEKARHDYFHSIGKPNKASSEEFKKPEPSIAEVQKLAATLDGLAPQLLSQFPAGSGPESGVKTGAKAVIWTKPADFKAAADKFATAAHTYNLVAQKGDVAASKAAFYAMGATCKGCHETFRTEEEHH